MGRKRCCAKVGLNRGAWSTQEDEALVNYINNHGIDNWRSLPQRAGLKRCGKSCRLRWLNYLRPGIRRGNISSEEEDLIIKLHSLLGNRWALIAGRLPGRTDNEIKNYWNTTLGGKLRRRGQPLKRGPSAVRRHRKSTRKDPRTTPNPNPTPNFNPSPQPIRTKAFRCGKNTFIPTGAENQPVLERNASFISGAGSSVSSDPVDHGDFDFIAMGMDIDEELLASWDDLFQIRGGGGGGGDGAGIEDETPLLAPLRGELKKVACLLDLGDEWEGFVS